MRKGFFAYAWDMLDEGVEKALDMMAEPCGCNALAVSASYHSARILRPRWPGPKVYDRQGPAVAFRPTPAFYREGAPLPLVEEPLAQANVLGQIREGCRQRQMDLAFWTVGLHNSELGRAHPDLCMRNCFGDIYTYSLCPSKPPVRAYLGGMIRDLCQGYHPDRILLETAGFLGLEHWTHHEKIGIPLDESTQMLLFLCFCPDCAARAATEGLDVEAIRQRAATLSQALMDHERGALPAQFTIADTPALLCEFPELYAYIQVRVETAATLVSQAREVAREFGAALEVMPAAFGLPVTRSWREGMAIRRLAQASDALIPLGYFADPAQVRADLRWTKMLSGCAPMSVGLTACQPITTSGSLLTANAVACAREGAAGIYYYNYGMLNENRLGWVAQANAAAS